MKRLREAAVRLIADAIALERREWNERCRKTAIATFNSQMRAIRKREKAQP